MHILTLSLKYKLHATISLRMQLMQIIKVIMTYDYWICRPLLALNPCKKYQIMYAIVHSYSCKCMRNKYPVCMKCPHTSHVEGDQFLNSQNAWACWHVVARAIIFEIPLLTVKCTFPEQMHGQFLQIMASKLPSQPSSSPIYYMNLS